MQVLSGNEKGNQQASNLTILKNWSDQVSIPIPIGGWAFILLFCLHSCLLFFSFFLPLLHVLQFYACFISDIKTIITPNRSYLYIVSIILFFFSFLFYFQQFVVIASLTSSDLSYDNYVFPEWANQIGWGVALSSMLMVPSYAMYKFCSLSGTFREVCIKICSAHNV